MIVIDVIEYIINLITYVGPAAILTVLVTIVPSYLFLLVVPKIRCFRNKNLLYLFPQCVRYNAGFRYKEFVKSEEEIFRDPVMRILSELVGTIYTNKGFERYYKNLYKSHLQIHILMNWVMTIIEDVSKSVSVSYKISYWDEYFHSGDFSENAPAQGNVILEEYELTCLWGCVYFYFQCLNTHATEDSMLKNIESVACQKTFTKPYFKYFKNQSIAYRKRHTQKNGGNIVQNITNSQIFNGNITESQFK